MKKSYDSKFKSRVALEALRGDLTVTEIAGKYQIHPNLVQQWKKKLQESASDVFMTKAERKAENKPYTESTDITYTAVDGHRAFVIGVVDWFSRKLMAYNVVNTMDAFHCVETLRIAIERFGKPEIFNADQGSQ